MRLTAPRKVRLPLALLAAAWLPAIAGCGPSEENSETVPPTQQSTAAPVPVGSGFDFYVLSLSWSPSYCEAEGEDANGQQCKSGRPYAFVVHGLWPQFERGFPRDCPADDDRVANDTLRGLYDIMPSAGLIRHEWRTHGTCSGLSQEAYFGVLRMAREKLRIPDAYVRVSEYRTVQPAEVEQAFRQANASIPSDGIAVTCDDRFLREVRICMTKELAFRSCQEIDRRACRSAKAVMPPVRGGKG